MPRKKNNRPANQKRLIASRLMQISLLVDDYLYQQKPMSERSAVAYIEEIATYKDKCCQDARSLQVIEKLTRCMTAIIYEQKELHGAGTEDINALDKNDDRNETNVIPAPYKAQENDNNVMLSPVYSEIDEDLTQIPQYFDVENYIELTASYIANDNDNNKNYNNQAEIVPLGMKEIQTDSTIDVQNRDAAGISLGMESDSEVINLCDKDIDEMIQLHTSFRHEPEFNIQKAISNLSIGDIDENFAPFSQQCSQSILNDLNMQRTYQPKPTLAFPKSYDDVVKTAEILQKPATDMVSFRHGPTKIVLPTTKQNRQRVHVQDKLNKPERKYTKKMQKKETVCTKTTAPKDLKQTKRKYRKIANDCKIDANGTGRNAKKRKTKATNKKLQENKDLSIKEKPLPVYSNKNKPSMPGYQIDINMKTPTYQNILTTASTNSNMSHDISENTVVPVHIQNKVKSTYIQNLSWVEKLRFVREIQVEEFEPFTDEGFWENYDLPAKFNEEDFDY